MFYENGTKVMKKEKSKHVGNVYDRIFKENAEHIFIPLIELQFNLRIKSFFILKEKIYKLNALF